LVARDEQGSIIDDALGQPLEAAVDVANEGVVAKDDRAKRSVDWAAAPKTSYVCAQTRRLSDRRDREAASSSLACRLARRRASRRQPNNCCGVSPCRRATAETFSPLS
jgi:hypothetical protein